MSSVHINSQDSLNELFKGIEQLDTASFEKVVSFISTLKTKRKTKHLSKRETELLLKINTLIPQKIQFRIDELNYKKQKGDFSEKDKEELTSLLFNVEELDAQRLVCLTELAKIRDIPVLKLMQQLKLLPKSVKNV